MRSTRQTTAIQSNLVVLTKCSNRRHFRVALDDSGTQGTGTQHAMMATHN